MTDPACMRGGYDDTGRYKAPTVKSELAGCQAYEPDMCPECRTPPGRPHNPECGRVTGEDVWPLERAKNAVSSGDAVSQAGNVPDSGNKVTSCPACGAAEDIEYRDPKDGMTDAEAGDRLCDAVFADIESTTGRHFASGAYRDSDVGKADYEGFLSPLVIQAFGDYMDKHRVQSDGELRDSDNWQQGIPRAEYMKSAWRHLHDLWMEHRGYESRDGIDEALGGLLFNVCGYWLELLKERRG